MRVGPDAHRNPHCPLRPCALWQLKDAVPVEEVPLGVSRTGHRYLALHDSIASHGHFVHRRQKFRIVTQGVAGTAARRLQRCSRFKDAALHKAMVGVERPDDRRVVQFPRFRHDERPETVARSRRRRFPAHDKHPLGDAKRRGIERREVRPAVFKPRLSLVRMPIDFEVASA